MHAANIKIGLLTAPPFAGKSTLSRRIGRDLGLPILDCDNDIFCRAFRLLGQPDLGQAIRPLGAWQHLRSKGVIDELYQTLHRDWYLTAGEPKAFLAVGWIYCLREWREQARQAFAAVPGVQADFALFLLRLPHEMFADRYATAHIERFGNGYGFLDKTQEVRRRDADRFYDEFLNNDLERPGDADKMAFHEGGDEDLMGSIAAWCRSSQ